MAGRGEGTGAGGVRDAGLQQGKGGGCGPGVLAGLLDLVQQLTAADRQDRAFQQRPQLVGGPHALVGERRGSGKWGRCVLPARQTEEAHARRPNFSGTSSAVGIWAVCRTACTSSGSAQKAATTSRVRRRSHDGLRWRAKNWLMDL